MKKFTKVSLIVCGVLAGVGLLLCVVGVGFGFQFRQLKRVVQDSTFHYPWGGSVTEYTTVDWNDEEPIKIGDIDVGNIDTGDIDTGRADTGDIDTGSIKKHHLKEHEHDDNWKQVSEQWSMENVENLDIQFTFGTLVLEPTDSEYIEAEMEYRSTWNSYNRAIECELKGDTLKVKDTVDKKIMHMFSHNEGDAVLVLRIPEEMEFQKVKMDIGAAYVYVNTEISGEDMDIILGAGEMKNGAGASAMLEADEMHLEIGAGHVELDGIDAGKLHVECGTGQIEVTGADADTARIECGVGQITMAMTDDEEAYNYNVDCGIGQVVVGENSYSGLGRSQQIKNGGEKDMNIDCGIGQITISFEQ